MDSLRTAEFDALLDAFSWNLDRGFVLDTPEAKKAWVREQLLLIFSQRTPHRA